jgi:hypothetical protein
MCKQNIPFDQKKLPCQDFLCVSCVCFPHWRVFNSNKGIYPKECDSGCHKGTCTPMFIAALFTITKVWKQPRCSTTDEWIKKVWHYTPWNFIQPQRRKKFFYLQVNGWNWRTSPYAKLARLKRPKITCSPSYVDYRPKTNAEILLDMGHTLRGECAWEE